MKTLKYLLAAIILLAIFRCADQPSSRLESAFAKSDGVSDECFDIQMEQWYKSFEKYQSEGLDMADADAKAVQDAMAACKTCMTPETEE